MYRRKVTLTAAAVFAIGVAFAAEPISERPDPHGEYGPQRALWVPGTNMPMSSYEPMAAPMAPPR